MSAKGLQREPGPRVLALSITATCPHRRRRVHPASTFLALLRARGTRRPQDVKRPSHATSRSLETPSLARTGAAPGTHARSGTSGRVAPVSHGGAGWGRQDSSAFPAEGPLRETPALPPTEVLGASRPRCPRIQSVPRGFVRPRKGDKIRGQERAEPESAPVSRLHSQVSAGRGQGFSPPQGPRLRVSSRNAGPAADLLFVPSPHRALSHEPPSGAGDQGLHILIPSALAFLLLALLGLVVKRAVERRKGEQGARARAGLGWGPRAFGAARARPGRAGDDRSPSRLLLSSRCGPAAKPSPGGSAGWP